MAEFFRTWKGIVDSMVKALPEDAAGRDRLVCLQEEIRRYLAGNVGLPEEIEAKIQSFAAEQPDLLVDTAEGLMLEVFELIDPEIERCRRAKANNSLTDKDQTGLKAYVKLLERSDHVLDDMKQRK